MTTLFFYWGTSCTSKASSTRCLFYDCASGVESLTIADDEELAVDEAFLCIYLFGCDIL